VVFALSLVVGVAACELNGGTDSTPDLAQYLANPEADEAAPLFAWDRVQRYTITMSAKHRAQMERGIQSKDPAQWEQYYPATLEFAGGKYTEVAIRYKGSFGTLETCRDGGSTGDLPPCNKFSIKIKFNEYNDEARFFGLKRLNFHSMARDYARMNEVLAYRMYRDMNVPAPRATFAALTINGEDLGVFALVEQIDSEFLNNRFSDKDGLLFKEVWPSNLGVDNPDWYLEGRLRTNRSEQHGFAAFKAFASAITKASDKNYLDMMNNWIDLPAFERYMVADRFMGNFDGVLAFYCFEGIEQGCINHNFYIYESSRGKRHWIIPWDLDRTFPAELEPYTSEYGVAPWTEASDCEWIAAPPGSGTSIRPPACDPMLGGFIEYDREAFAAALIEAAEGTLAVTTLHGYIDQLAMLLRPALEVDPRNDLAINVWEEQVQLLKANVAALHQSVRAMAAAL
jgi:hypothetical protein